MLTLFCDAEKRFSDRQWVLLENKVLFGDFLRLFGQPYGYVDVVVLLFGGFLFSAGLLASSPEEGPADDPDD